MSPAESSMPLDFPSLISSATPRFACWRMNADLFTCFEGAGLLDFLAFLAAMRGMVGSSWPAVNEVCSHQLQEPLLGL